MTINEIRHNMAINNKSYNEWSEKFQLFKSKYLFYCEFAMERFTNCLRNENAEKYLCQYFEQHPKEINLKFNFRRSHRHHHGSRGRDGYLYYDRPENMTIIQLIAEKFYKINKPTILSTLIYIGFDIIYTDQPIISLLLYNENYDLKVIDLILSYMKKMKLDDKKYKNICDAICYGFYTGTNLYDHVMKMHKNIDSFNKFIDKCAELIILCHNHGFDISEYFCTVRRDFLYYDHALTQQMFILSITSKIYLDGHSRYCFNLFGKTLEFLFLVEKKKIQYKSHGNIYQFTWHENNYDTMHVDNYDIMQQLLYDIIRKLILHEKIIIDSMHLLKLKKLASKSLYYLALHYFPLENNAESMIDGNISSWKYMMFTICSAYEQDTQ